MRSAKKSAACGSFGTLQTIKWGLGLDFTLAQALILLAVVFCRVFCSRNRFEVREHGFFFRDGGRCDGGEGFGCLDFG